MAWLALTTKKAFPLPSVWPEYSKDRGSANDKKAASAT